MNLLWRCQRGGLSFFNSFASKNIRYRSVSFFIISGLALFESLEKRDFSCFCLLEAKFESF